MFFFINIKSLFIRCSTLYSINYSMVYVFFFFFQFYYFLREKKKKREGEMLLLIEYEVYHLFLDKLFLFPKYNSWTVETNKQWSFILFYLCDKPTIINWRLVLCSQCFEKKKKNPPNLYSIDQLVMIDEDF